MKIAIIGASGYAGGDIIRLLLSHPRAEVTCATSRKFEGTPLDSVHPHLKGYTDLNFENPFLDSLDIDVAFLSVPHTAAMTYARPLLDRGIKIVDLSADYRLPKETFEKVYGVAHTDYFEAPYGIPELHRDEYRSAAFVSNPGCFPTGATLAAAPLIPYAHTVIYDSKTGVSGAGDNPSETTHYPNVADNITTNGRSPAPAEMRMRSAGQQKARCYFTPHRFRPPRNPYNCACPPERTDGSGDGGEPYKRRTTPESISYAPETRACRGQGVLVISGQRARRPLVVVSPLTILVWAAGQATE